MGLIVKPQESAGVLVGPDGKTPLPAAPLDRKARRRAYRKLCDRCHENPKSRKLPNGLRVCHLCYLDDNPLGAAVIKNAQAKMAKLRKLQEAKRAQRPD